MEYRIYLIDDNPDKNECFIPILHKINENEAQSYFNGFDEKLNDANRDYELIQTALESSNTENCYWIVDLQFSDDHFEIAEKLRTAHFKDKKELLNYINDFPEAILGGNRFYLSMVLIAILKKKEIPFCISSTAALAVPSVREIMEHYTLINYPLDIHNENGIAKVAYQIIKDIHAKFKHPIEVFLGYFQGNNCHAADKRDFTCFEYLSAFLGYSSKRDFLKEFKLIGKDGMNGYKSPNLFEEVLKTFSAKGENGLSLAGVIIICWAAYRRTSSTNGKFSDSNFISLLKKLDKLFSEVDMAHKANQAMHIARYGKVIPRQDANLFELTLRALYDMIQPLYTHEITNKNMLQGVKFQDGTFFLFLAIKDNGNLVRTLNKVHYRLVKAIDEGRFVREHTTSMRVLKYWLLSNTSKEQIQTSGGPNTRFSRDCWGNDSHFSIETREGKGITIKFSL